MMNMSYGEEGVGPTLTSRPIHVGIFAPLPTIDGVKPLSSVDIKNDITEIEKNLYDDESDGSVLSDDILTAKFPVKPRKTFKIPKNPPPQLVSSDDEKGPQTEESLDQAMAFLNTVETTYKEVADAERKREALDVTYQAIKDAYLLQVSRFTDAQKQYGNYFRVLQGVAARSVQMYALYNRRNAILCDILESLKQRKNTISNLESAPKVPLRSDEVNEYRVTINPPHQEENGNTTPTAANVTLYKGQYVQTVMGEGVVQHILPAEMKLVIKLLGFGGVLYVNIKTYLAYVIRKYGSKDVYNSNGALSRLVDQSTSDSMLARWQGYERQLHLSDVMEVKIHSVLSDSSPANGSCSATGSGETLPAQFTPELRAILGRKSLCVALNVPDGESSGTESEDESLSRSTSSESLDQSSEQGVSAADSAEMEVESSAPTANAADDDAEEEHKSARFFNLTRGVLPLVYAPVSSMSNVVDAMINDSAGRTQTTSGQATVKLCKSAFGAKTSCGLDVSTDLAFLKKSLQRLYKEVHDVEEHQTSMMKEIEAISADTAQIMGRTMRERMHLLNARGPMPGPFGLVKGNRSSKAKTIANVSSDASITDLVSALLSRAEGTSAESDAESEVEEPVAPVSTRSGASRLPTTTSVSDGIAIRGTNDSKDQSGTKASVVGSSSKPPNGRTPPTTALTNISAENITSGSRNSKRGASDISKPTGVTLATAGVGDDGVADANGQRRIRSRKS